MLHGGQQFRGAGTNARWCAQVVGKGYELPFCRLQVTFLKSQSAPQLASRVPPGVVIFQQWTQSRRDLVTSRTELQQGLRTEQSGQIPQVLVDTAVRSQTVVN